MIIGEGSIAKLLNDRNGLLFFASGIADSGVGCNTYRMEKHEREKKLLFHWLEFCNEHKLMIVYFGTISKFLNKGFYVDHKNKMESMIRELALNYTIINLGNVWECTNPHTFRNAMKRFEAEGGKNVIHDEYKYMISKEQLNFITDNLPTTGKHEISIFGEALKVEECLKQTK